MILGIAPAIIMRAEDGGVEFVGGAFIASGGRPQSTIDFSALSGGIDSAPSAGDLVVLSAFRASNSHRTALEVDGWDTLELGSFGECPNCIMFYVASKVIGPLDNCEASIAWSSPNSSDGIVIIANVIRAATGVFSTRLDFANRYWPTAPSVVTAGVAAIIEIGATRGEAGYAAGYGTVTQRWCRADIGGCGEQLRCQRGHNDSPCGRRFAQF